jgi:asparagine synthase (glutamine-hydrolysing)
VSGFVAMLHHDGAPLDRELLARMTAAQRFRGPDGAGSWAGTSVGLGHTLHRSTLEAAREVQPWTLDGQVHVSADARIDGRAELCRKLRGRGQDAHEDATDPELILQAYASWGTACVEHLLGDFSFALWDGPNRRLLCAVDPLGVKPLYYVDRAGLMAASNSLQPLHLHPGVSQELDETAVGDFLMWGHYLDRDVTIFRDIVRLLPGQRLVVEDGVRRLERYFTFPEPEEVRWSSDAECLEAFRELFDAAVRDRLRTPRVGIALSGGLDSPLIAESAKRQLFEQFGADHALEAITMVFDRVLVDDERHYAGLVAEHLGIATRWLPLDDDPLFELEWLQGRPEPSIAGGGRARREAWTELRARCPVILNGYDGDALLKGAASLHWRTRWRQGRLTDLARELRWYVQTQQALPPVGVRNALKRWRGGHTRPELPAWLGSSPGARRALEPRWNQAFEAQAPEGPRTPTRDAFATSSWGALFTRQDAGHSGVAAEHRCPLADLRVIRFALGLPTVPWCIDKELLRRSCEGRLPGEVQHRPKTPLRADPKLANLARRGLGISTQAWATDALAAYLDPKLLAAQLAANGPSPVRHAALHAVALGVWLSRAR